MPLLFRLPIQFRADFAEMFSEQDKRRRRALVPASFPSVKISSILSERRRYGGIIVVPFRQQSPDEAPKTPTVTSSSDRK